ncbi:MAG: ATP-binding protein [Phenylobacterium sp.]|uniref:ATP-binding protein n=1 Tax=Phenylobacterium sp. TaxID=1871053 RepID=UPI00271D9314|nr:ATP-binding protein [Phenylobacterium sp.]MDO8408807.1 ATP-binding protein [Phenylobacterium sp.]
MLKLTARKPADITVSPEVLAQSQTPILRTYVLAAAIYYAVVSVSHPFFEVGSALIILTGLSVVATIMGLLAWRWLKQPQRLLRLEAAALLMNALFMANVVAYLSLHFEALKLIYFVLMALVFAIAAPTRRVAYVSTLAAFVGMVLMARAAPGHLIGHYAYVGVAGVFAALGMSTLMRGAVMREIRARLATDEVNVALRHELTRNQALTREAQELAVAARAADRAKSEFLATMSHEIRTPLNGVLGMVQVMALDDLPTVQRERLAVVQDSASTLLDILNAILDIARIEAGEMTITAAEFDIDRLIGPLGTLYGQIAAERGLTFTLDLAPEARGGRLGDEVRLRQVISNLISNALKFTETGSISVRIGGDAKSLTCEVTDTGIGIPLDHQATIFDKFVQADASNTRRSGGTGLGLAICRDLVALMGGKIEFTSQPGLGTTFTLSLPMARTTPAYAGDEPPAAGPPAAGVRGRRILIVDDNGANRMVLKTLLESQGLDCGQSADGHEAILAWGVGGWDLILMDIHMPGMDGMDATKVIRAAELDAGLPRTPILALTASVMTHETQRYLGVGMDGVAAKPVQLGPLMRQIEQALGVAKIDAVARSASVSRRA